MTTTRSEDALTFEAYDEFVLEMAGGCYLPATQPREPLAALRTAVLGLLSEAGELASILKKAEERGTEVDFDHLREEAGDALWYLPLIAWLLCTTTRELASANITKLRARHPDRVRTPVIPKYQDL